MIWWIGLNDRLEEGEFVWDGIGTNNNGFTKWRHDQPDDWKNEDCVEFDKDYGTWNDRSCTLKSPFICQMEKEIGTGIELITNSFIDFFTFTSSLHLMKSHYQQTRVLMPFSSDIIFSSRL